MSIADKLTTIAENEQKVYEAGMADGMLNAEIAFTSNWKRTGYARAFCQSDWNGHIFSKTIQPSEGANSISRMFYDYRGTVLPRNIDLSKATQSSIISEGGNAGQLFAWSLNVLIIPDYGLPALNFGSSFTYLRSCHTIEKIRIDETNTPPNFTDTTKLKNLTFEGVIGKNISVSVCTLLTHESLMNIIECLKDYSEDTSGTVYKCSIGTTNLAKLTDEEKAIATQKGWTLA